MQMASMAIWDEFVMSNRENFEAVDDMLKVIRGGKHQIFPALATVQPVYAHTINATSRECGVFEVQLNKLHELLSLKAYRMF